MSQSDPIADFITVIRNGLGARKSSVDVPFSKMKRSIADILAREGFVEGCEEFDVTNSKGNKFKWLRVNLRYGDDLKRITPINQLERISTPGRRVYVGRHELPKVRGGYGISILSTSDGVISDRDARRLNVGGELLVKVW